MTVSSRLDRQSREVVTDADCDRHNAVIGLHHDCAVGEASIGLEIIMNIRNDNGGKKRCKHTHNSSGIIGMLELQTKSDFTQGISSKDFKFGQS